MSRGTAPGEGSSCRHARQAQGLRPPLPAGLQESLGTVPEKIPADGRWDTRGPGRGGVRRDVPAGYTQCPGWVQKVRPERRHTATEVLGYKPGALELCPAVRGGCAGEGHLGSASPTPSTHRLPRSLWTDSREDSLGPRELQRRTWHWVSAQPRTCNRGAQVSCTGGDGVGLRAGLEPSLSIQLPGLFQIPTMESREA